MTKTNKKIVKGYILIDNFPVDFKLIITSPSDCKLSLNGIVNEEVINPKSLVENYEKYYKNKKLTKDEYGYSNFADLIKNKAECAKCHDIIESTHRHHFLHCKCGEIFLDGGRDYWRCGANDLTNILRIYEFDIA